MRTFFGDASFFLCPDFLLLRKWLFTSLSFLHNHCADPFKSIFLCHIMSLCSPLMTSRGLSVSIYRANGAVSSPSTFSMFREKINFPLLCQKLGNYFNLTKIQLWFQREFMFQHFKSSDISSSRATVRWWQRTGTQAFEQIHLSLPTVHDYVSFKPVEGWLI